MTGDRTKHSERLDERDLSAESLIRQWDGEEVILRFDRPTGSWIVIAIHSTLHGMAGGGTRMKVYPNLGAAVRDALRLSEAMSAKFILADFAWGGAKAVIAVSPGLDQHSRRDLLRRYGTLVHQLGGLFHTGPDVGTSSSDMDIIAEAGAPYVHGRTLEAGGSGDSGPPTALGVLYGVRAVAARLFGSASLAGKAVLVQGTGSVGKPLVGHLVDAGARVLVSDINSEAAGQVAQQYGVGTVDPDDVYSTPCDIFAPCALGGILNHETIPCLQCRGIAGSANNQLQTVDDAVRLRERAILYAPDFVINVGGVLALLGIEGQGWSHEELERRIAETVTSTLQQIFELTEAEDITTVAAAGRIVDTRREAMNRNRPAPGGARNV